jgi:hypothetical protein
MGHRTVQTLKIPQSIHQSMELLRLKRARDSGKQVLLADIYDAALKSFLDAHSQGSFAGYLASPKGEGGPRAIWVDSVLLEQAECMARRDGVPRNRLVYTAVVSYIESQGRPGPPKNSRRASGRVGKSRSGSAKSTR